MKKHNKLNTPKEGTRHQVPWPDPDNQAQVISGIPEWYECAESVAKRVGKDRKTIFRWANKGLFARYKVSRGVVLFDPREVLAYVASCRVVSTNLAIDRHDGFAA